jgi:hypothetical protein
MRNGKINGDMHMADLNELNQNLQTREYDELEKALVARPLLKAPRRTRENVMARIAALPQTEQAVMTLTATLAARYPAPTVKYMPSAVLPLPDPPVELLEEAAEQRQRRMVWGVIFTGMWLGACLFGLWLIWPAVSNLIFGPPTDPEMQAHLQALQTFWNNLTGFLVNTWSTYGLLLPSLLSGAIGLSLMMTFIFGPPRHHLRWR